MRPMSLGPVASVVTAGKQMSPNDGSGGPPPPPPNVPPIETYSGGAGSVQVTSNGQPVPGQYKAVNPVPVGTVAYLSVGSPAPNDPNYVITKTTWSGGTNYSGYFSAPPNTTADGGQTLEKNVATTTSNYIFIVDSTQRNYTITVNVTYAGGSTGTSTLTFGSDRPDAAIGVKSAGTQSFSTTDPEYPGEAVVQLLPAIFIEATAATDLYTAGSFIFMQVVNTTDRRSVDEIGDPTYKRNDASQPPFDGPLIDGGAIGYPYVYQGSVFNTGWSLGANASIPTIPYASPWMSDRPANDVPLDYQMTSASDTFSTYLMYQPTTNVNVGVWIALGELDWSWSETATAVAGTWTAPPDSPQPAPTNQTPSGDAAFPTWVNTTSAFSAAKSLPGP